jgi:hypothetical protein
MFWLLRNVYLSHQILANKYANCHSQPLPTFPLPLESDLWGRNAHQDGFLRRCKLHLLPIWCPRAYHLNVTLGSFALLASDASVSAWIWDPCSSSCATN